MTTIDETKSAIGVLKSGFKFIHLIPFSILLDDIWVLCCVFCVYFKMRF